MKIRAISGIVAVAASSVVFGVGAPAKADNHCSIGAGPRVAITSGYWGVGGVGAFDGYGCVEGQQVADTRLIYPSADFVLLVVANAGCTPGSQTTGSLNGLGVNAAVPMGCVEYPGGATAYVGDPYAIDKMATGTIDASAEGQSTRSTKLI